MAHARSISAAVPSAIADTCLLDHFIVSSCRSGGYSRRNGARWRGMKSWVKYYNMSGQLVDTGT